MSRSSAKTTTADVPQPTRSAPLVSARDIGVRRARHWIVRHADLKVGRGELVFVIGANGAGKSTCVKTALGLIDIDEGTVERASALEIGAVVAGIASVAGGLLASAEWDTPSGPSIVVTALALFVVTRIRRPRPAGGAR